MLLTLVWLKHIDDLLQLCFYLPCRRRPEMGDIATIISSIPLFWFCISNVGVVWGGGGGGCNVFLTFYAISNIYRKKYLGIQNNYFSFNVFFVCFFVCWKYWKVPLHLQLLVKWEVVSPNSRYREFYHEIGNIEKCPFTYWLNGGGGFSKS